jgi:hypothetical protein
MLFVPSEHVIRLDAGFRSANGRPAVAGSGTTSVQLFRSSQTGHAPPPAVLVMGYYVGTLANTLALRGGIGGIEGGMTGAFLAFGVNKPSRPRHPGIPHDLVPPAQRSGVIGTQLRPRGTVAWSRC